MDEVGACGTATVCVPIGSITHDGVKHEFGKFEILNELRTELMAIQLGEAEDKHGWMVRQSTRASQAPCAPRPKRASARAS